jgi:uroporphyrinogen decarboxylase
LVDIVNGLGARGRGYEQLLVEIMTQDPVVLALIDRQLEAHFEFCRRGLEAGRGEIDVLLIGEDCGIQSGPLFSPAMFRAFFAPRIKRFVDLAHAQGAACMMHCCGSVRQVLPIFIEKVGLDILQAVQPEAVGMDPEGLKRDFGDHITFCGMISLQKTLTRGTVEECRREAEHRVRVIGKGGGYIFSPANTITLDAPLENVLAIYEVVTGKALM